MKSLKSYEHLLWRNGNAILNWPKPVVLRSNLWFPDDNRCLLSDSRCSEHSGISYLHLHSYSLKFFYIASLIVFEGSGFLDSCWNSNSLLEGTLLWVLRWSPDFHAIRLIQAHMPNSYNIFPFFIKQIFVMSRRFPADSSSNFFSPSRHSLTLVNSRPGIFCTLLFTVFPLASHRLWSLPDHLQNLVLPLL